MQSINQSKHLWGGHTDPKTLSAGEYDPTPEDPGGPHCCWNLCTGLGMAKTPRTAPKSPSPKRP